MASHTNKVVPTFDFRRAEALPVTERFRVCLERARVIVDDGYASVSEAPCVPSTGATEAELAGLESQLGIPLPSEYRAFLAQCRYLALGEGTEVGGFDHEGVDVTERPWVSSEHREAVSYLVFANYWRYADGDQLMFDLSVKSHPVVVYLHEHGPLFELYAPSFSLALWRLVHEAEGADE